jgi:type IV pilus assembly protein PilX
MKTQSYGPSRQGGVVLIISLVLLVVMAILGATAMETGGVQLKMASANKQKQEAFELAEHTLAVIEQQIEDGVYGGADLGFQDCADGDATCFDELCTGGTCFDGEYTAGDDRIDCERDGATLTPIAVWEVDGNWSDANKHQTLSVSFAESDPKYIIEFLCYIERGDGTVFDTDPANVNNGSPYFRITTLAASEGGKSEVMLQSTYRLNGV